MLEKQIRLFIQNWRKMVIKTVKKTYHLETQDKLKDGLFLLQTAYLYSTI